jgi:hypothetical protein
VSATDDQRKQAQDLALTTYSPRVGRIIHARIVSLRIAAGDSLRLNAELDGLVEEVLAAGATAGV